MSGWFSDPGSAILASIAIIISAWAAWSSHKTQKIEWAQELDRATNKLKASIVVQNQNSDGDICNFTITNTGEGTARNIVVEIADKPLDHYRCVNYSGMRRGDYNRQPPVIGPKNHVSYSIYCSEMLNILPCDVKITWDDDFGKSRKWEGSIG